MSRARIGIAALVLSAAGFLGVVRNEGYTDHAIQPVSEDRPTIGYGSTRYADGRAVEMGDKITQPEAERLARTVIAEKEGVLKGCWSDIALTQGEYDAYVDLAYNVGPYAVCRSSITKKLRAGQYAAACRTILDFKRVQGRDCSLPENRRFCGGIWTRRQESYRICMGELQ